VRATLFDFNGVLVDDEHVHFASFREVLASRGCELDEGEYVERYLGFDDVGAFRAIAQDRGLSWSDEAIAALVMDKQPIYMRRIATDLRVFPFAAELVGRRASRGPVGVVSGALRPEIEHGLRALGVRDAVSFVVSAEDTRACKPDPEGYLLGRARLGVDRLAVALEDSTAGVVAAKSAGLRCVAVTHSYPRAALVEAGADAVVDTLAQVTDALLDGAE
jgi:beta-phosphoglucomutase-like phosphatase (HAD superfamily)